MRHAAAARNRMRPVRSVLRTDCPNASANPLPRGQAAPIALVDLLDLRTRIEQLHHAPPFLAVFRELLRAVLAHTYTMSPPATADANSRGPHLGLDIAAEHTVLIGDGREC